MTNYFLRKMGIKTIINKFRELGFKKFMKEWGKGIEGITPLQQTKTAIMGTWIIITGIVWGMVVTYLTGVFWLFVVLVGSLIVTGVQLLGSYQKYITFNRIEKVMKNCKEGEKNV